MKRFLIGTIGIMLFFWGEPLFAIQQSGHFHSPIQQCVKFFQEIEELITEAEKQPGTHMQLGVIRNKFEQGKKEILEMGEELQAKSCEIGLEKLLGHKNTDM
ncbi:DUF5339 domain-containing protein [Avibacterium paragallinarum]|uniref:DUF5339 domain-containing protein n=2 Tax=Avibacterium paragallinarum TaxID=728 RepID=A0ABU7QL99_AVIPA|nr:DUF5339 domain-containing protein [Avibacterium paragallinarum]MEE3609652.1 DUF5339 domain-containing protein [Avibacterium paragallinarum]MEE3621789.1 DUF5339 domain-containing protein [Avibacterium paragallinarum]MEE3669402.1 DUF5339 domain-containing protein [Avibacterium paragallinarum]MEE3680911.1 DUF5339 domain-containing protein [Avibacterium paragallinarum]MEE4387005.1 DUF5339 domain-containing protein [Avibacterium paragallinarum]